MTNALEDMHNAVGQMRPHHAESRDMDEEAIEKYLAFLDAAAGVLNDHGLIEDQWTLRGFADGLVGILSEEAKDPNYGKNYVAGHVEGAKLGQIG